MKALMKKELYLFPRDKQMCLLYTAVIFISLVLFGSLIASSAFSRQEDHTNQHIRIKTHQYSVIIEKEFELLDASFDIMQTILGAGLEIEHDNEDWIREIFAVNKYANGLIIMPEGEPARTIDMTIGALFDNSANVMNNIDADRQNVTIFSDEDPGKAEGIVSARKILVSDNTGSVEIWGTIAVFTRFSEILVDLETADHDDYEYRIRLLTEDECVIYSSYNGDVLWDVEQTLETEAGKWVFESYKGRRVLAGKVTVYSMVLFAAVGISMAYNAQHMKIIRKSEYIEELNTKLKDLLITDYLTETKNRRGVYEFLEAFIPYAKRNGLPFCVAMLDLDNFKDINDLMGHDGGDRALVFFADRFIRRARKSDVIGRFGGDEFICVFTDCNAENAYRLSESFRKELMTEVFSYGENESVITFSMGITQYKEEDEAANLIWRADEGLYKAKKAGKNCIIVI